MIFISKPGNALIPTIIKNPYLEYSRQKDGNFAENIKSVWGKHTHFNETRNSIL